MFIYTEKSFDNLINEGYLMEADTGATHLIAETIYPKVDKVLSTPEGARKFGNLVGSYVNRNSSKLTTIGPIYLVPFTHSDKEGFYQLFNVTEQEIKAVINQVVKATNAKSNWLLIKNNPIFTLFYCVIRYFTIHRDAKQLNNALVITALAFYPSIFKKYFPFEPNPGVMHYTIDNLPMRFIIKKNNHVFGMLTYSIQGSWKFHEKDFLKGEDFEVIRFIQRIRNDQNSLLKKIANNYMINHKKGLSIYTQVDQYDDSVVVDNENDTNRVESITNKIVTNMIINGVDIPRCDVAARLSEVSRIELRNYLTNIQTEKKSAEMMAFVESILFLYLYDGKYTIQDINSQQFLSFANQLFKKTNSKDKNITNIKTTLDKWGEDTGIYGKFTRIATRVNYTKAIYLYFIMSIQKYA